MEKTLSVFKYPLAIEDDSIVELPLGARILSVGSVTTLQEYHRGTPSLWLWALVDRYETRTEQRFITLRGTGHPVTESAAGEYLGRIELQAGIIQFHVFERRHAPGAEPAPKRTDDEVRADINALLKRHGVDVHTVLAEGVDRQGYQYRPWGPGSDPSKIETRAWPESFTDKDWDELTALTRELASLRLSKRVGR